jgi:hypothetical protein
LQLQRLVGRLEVVEPHRHDERGEEDAGERRQQPGQRHPQPQHHERRVGQHLLAHEDEPEDGREGEKTGDLAHGLREPGLQPAELGLLDGEVVEQRRPAGEPQEVDERQRPQIDDG